MASSDGSDERLDDSITVPGSGGPGVFFHKDERELSIRELDELNYWKDVLSSAKIFYRPLLPHAKDRQSCHHMTTKGVGQAGMNELYKKITASVAKEADDCAHCWLVENTPPNGGVPEA